MKKRLLIIMMALLLFVTLALAGCDLLSGLFGGGDDGDDDDSGNASSYTITFKNYNGDILQSGKVEKGEMPEYEGETPQQPSTDEFEYTFIGWNPEIAEVTEAATYTAQFDAEAFRYESGDSSENNPYIILNAPQLKFFKDRINYHDDYDSDTYFALGADIDLKGAEWTAIEYFEGSFDGKGYKITNFKITKGRSDSGLFEYNEGTIKNVGLENFSINIKDDYSCVGGLVGYNRGEITNCYATGNIYAESNDDSAFAGGLVGNNSGRITNCYATGNVSSTASDYAITGGLVGYSDSDGTITNCYATGNIYAESNGDSDYAGGLIGHNSYGTITNCYATGNIYAESNGDSDYAGGLVGYNSYGTIANCYATGDVSATGSYSAYAGGLSGYNWNGTITNSYAIGEVFATSPSGAYAGGLSGYNWNGRITNCYAIGDVSATSSSRFSANAGGLVGYNNSGCTITNCYATGDVSATSSSGVYAGGLSGYNSGTIINCYRYDGQAFYRNDGKTEYDTESNDWGELCSKANLNSVVFYTNILGWDADVWDFSDLDFDAGIYPTLKGQ